MTDRSTISRQCDWLIENLTLSVPLAMMELETMTIQHRESTITRWLREAATVLPSEGDHIMWQADPRKSRYVITAGTRGTFVALSHGLAAAAFGVDGVTFLDRHWCVGHCDQIGSSSG